jgi:hypothetical protein
LPSEADNGAVKKQGRKDPPSEVGSDAEICTGCFALRGEIGGWRHLCDCDLDAYRTTGREVPSRGDLPIATELCRCCALELVPSGSRWSRFFCSECHERVVALNQAAHRCVIPIGRHSIMNGIFYRPGHHTMTHEEATAFYDQLTTFFGQTDATERWARRQTARNIDAVSMRQPGGVSLRTYLRLVRHASLSKRDAFDEMKAVAQRRTTP